MTGPYYRRRMNFKDRPKQNHFFFFCSLWIFAATGATGKTHFCTGLVLNNRIIKIPKHIGYWSSQVQGAPFTHRRGSHGGITACFVWRTWVPLLFLFVEAPGYTWKHGRAGRHGGENSSEAFLVTWKASGLIDSRFGYCFSLSSTLDSEVGACRVLLTLGRWMAMMWY